MKKNIAIIIPKLEGGGAERVASYLSIHLSKEFNIYLFVYNEVDNEYETMGEKIYLNLNLTKSINKIFSYIYSIFKIRRLKKIYKIDASISLLDNPNIINILSRYKDKVIISVRNNKNEQSKSLYGKIYKKLMISLYNKADTIVSISNGVKKDLIENFKVKKDKILTIYNPINIDKVRRLANEKIEDKYLDLFKGKTIITSARLELQKGQWNLIKAFKNVYDIDNEYKLVILGKGRLEYKLKKIAESYGLQENIYFLGFKNNPFKYIKNSQIFVLSSNYEGLGNVLIESIAIGTPIISTDCKWGPREILDPQNADSECIKTRKICEYGVLTPVCTENIEALSEGITKEQEEMSKSILYLLNNKNIISEYKNKYIERANEFSYNKIIKKWIDIL